VAALVETQNPAAGAAHHRQMPAAEAPPAAPLEWARAHRWAIAAAALCLVAVAGPPLLYAAAARGRRRRLRARAAGVALSEAEGRAVARLFRAVGGGGAAWAKIIGAGLPPDAAPEGCDPIQALVGGAGNCVDLAELQTLFKMIKSEIASPTVVQICTQATLAHLAEQAEQAEGRRVTAVAEKRQAGQRKVEAAASTPSGDAGAVPSRLRPLFPSQKAAAGAPVLGRGKVEALDSEDAAPDTHTPGGSQQSLLREVQSETT